MAARSAVWRGTAEILAAQAVTVAVALWQQWPIVLMVIAYWLQSVLVGVYTRQRLLAAGDFSFAFSGGFGHRPRIGPAAKRGLANEFLFHYGLTHLCLGVFLAAGVAIAKSIVTTDWLLVGGCVLASWIGLHLAHRRDVAADAGGRPEIGILVALPYGRVIPLFFCLGIAMVAHGNAELTGVGILLFGAITMIVDVATHLAEGWLVMGD